MQPLRSNVITKNLHMGVNGTERIVQEVNL